jgi:hypothetical protein
MVKSQSLVFKRAWHFKKSGKTSNLLGYCLFVSGACKAKRKFVIGLT